MCDAQEYSQSIRFIRLSCSVADSKAAREAKPHDSAVSQCPQGQQTAVKKQG